MDGYYIWAVSLMIPVSAHDFCCFYILHIIHLKKTTQTTKVFSATEDRIIDAQLEVFSPAEVEGLVVISGCVTTTQPMQNKARDAQGIPGIPKVSHD
jgi:hypothetical protein